MSLSQLTVIGESLVDLISSDVEDDAPGSFPGGSPMNVAVGCSRLGMVSNLVTHYANDLNGLVIENHLNTNGVTVIVDDSSRTSTAAAKLDFAGSAQYKFDITWDIGEALASAQSAIKNSAHVHTGSIASILVPGCNDTLALVEAARGHATISYDPNCRPAIFPDVGRSRGEVERFVATSDLVKASNEDLKWLYPDLTLEQSAQAWLEHGPSIVVVTCGADGSMLVHKHGIVRLVSEQIAISDTVGAGDSFMAGLIAWMNSKNLLGASARTALEHLSLHEMRDLLDYATRAAAITCSRQGANPPWSSELVNSAPVRSSDCQPGAIS